MPGSEFCLADQVSIYELSVLVFDLEIIT